MPLLTNFHLQLTVDQVLRAQGADPASIRSRSPRLVEAAAKALEEGLPLLQPQALYRRLSVEALRHRRVYLSEGAYLEGELIAQHLAPAREIIAALCTVGADLEEYASAMMASAGVQALALEGVASAAVEALANELCSRIETEAASQGWQCTVPLSPGMTGWSVEEGQPQIFRLLDSTRIGVTLTSSYVMVPRKSLTMVIGVGPELLQGATTCDFCNMRDTCQYREMAHGFAASTVKGVSSNTRSPSRTFVAGS
jgi:hypothetical protein